MIKGKISFKDSAWKHISKEAQEFIQKLLTKEQGKRPNAMEALKDKWFGKAVTINAEHTIESGPVMAQFNAKQKLKQAAQDLIVSSSLDKQEFEDLTEFFKKMDVDGSGKLSIKDLKQYNLDFFGVDFDDETMQGVLDLLDTDKDG